MCSTYLREALSLSKFSARTVQAGAIPFFPYLFIYSFIPLSIAILYQSNTVRSNVFFTVYLVQDSTENFSM